MREPPQLYGQSTDSPQSVLNARTKFSFVWPKPRGYHLGEFGHFNSTGGHSYQYGHYICDYYLKSLGLPEIGGKGLYAAQK